MDSTRKTEKLKSIISIGLFRLQKLVDSGFAKLGIKKTDLEIHWDCGES